MASLGVADYCCEIAIVDFFVSTRRRSIVGAIKNVIVFPLIF